MDVAVALVQAYLHINGYFTVTEYPVVEAMKHGGYRTATDLDVLAVRFPHAGRLVPSHGKRPAAMQFEPDPKLHNGHDHIDMIIGEVKEGRAELNRGARNPDVLEAVLARFGCCDAEAIPDAVDALLHQGRGTLGGGHHVRMMAFGATIEEPLGYPCEVMSLGHVISFCRGYFREHWDVLRQAQFKDVALSFLMTLEKAEAAIDSNR